MEKDGKNRWNFRAPLLSKVINEFNPGLLGTQEGHRDQIFNLAEKLEKLTLVDSHREWIEERMYPSIFYDQNLFKLIKSGDCWLSETPDIPASSSFDSAYPRLFSWGKFIEKSTNTEFFFVSTHFDHVKESTRIEQARVLGEEIKKINTETLPLVICGDFNADPQSLTRENILKEIPELYDPWIYFHAEEFISYHKWGKIPDDGCRIDWFLLSNGIKVDYLRFDVTEESGVFPSDHFPLKIKFNLN